MKFLILLLPLLYTPYVFANDTINCHSEKNGKNYTLSPVSGNIFKLTVSGPLANDPSCHTRWGCEPNAQLFQEELRFTGSYDRPQGTLDVYKSKRSRLEIQDDYGVYTYVIKNRVGTFINQTVILECEI